jgi:hypothetical protein
VLRGAAPAGITVAFARRTLPPIQKRTFGSAAAFFTHPDRLPRNVDTRMWRPTRTAARGVFDTRPVFRPMVSSTMIEPGARAGDPIPFRTEGSTTRFRARKKRASAA